MAVLRGFLQLDTIGNIEVDSNGCVNCIIEDGKQLKLLRNELDLSAATLKFIFDGTQICVDLPKSRQKIHNNRQQNQNEYDKHDINDEHGHDEYEGYNEHNGHDEHEHDKNDKNDQSEAAINTTSWYWNDAATKLLLDIYKCKKGLVSTRKIKTYKVLWKSIAEEMGHYDYLVTPLQVENKIKSLERSYKNMISNNKMTGRARKTCKYEAELTDLLGEKHNIQPLAVSGRNGLVLHEKLRSNKENNIAVNNVTDTYEDLENNFSSINDIAPVNEKINKLQTTINRIRQNTTSAYISKCQAALDTYISEKSNEKEHNESIQMQILEEFRNIKKTQDFVNSAKRQWIIANAKRDESITVLREIAKNIEHIAYNSNV